jgi:HlyD family secretion protein
MFKAIAVILALVVAALGGYLLSGGSFYGKSTPAATATTATTTDEQWVAAAPGRVEPGSGEFRLGAAVIGKVADVPVKVKDDVEEGELLIRLDDEEARATLAAAEAEEGLHRRERDAQPATAGRQDVTKGEDGVYSAEREVTGARFELDAALAARRHNEATPQQLSEARKRLQKAEERVDRERLAYAQAQAKNNLPSPNQFESALTASRAKVALAATQLDKTRIRAPKKGTVLELNAKQGEIVAPSPDQPLAVVGDMSLLQVKAELDDGSADKIEKGRKAFVTSINFPNKRFEGTVKEISPTMASPRINPRGPLRASDIQVLEITIELDPKDSDVSKLLPGMRVDAFVKPKA